MQKTTGLIKAGRSYLWSLLLLALFLMSGTARVLAQESRALPFLETQTDAAAMAMGNLSLRTTGTNHLYTNPTALFGQTERLHISGSGLLYPHLEGVQGRLHYLQGNMAYRLAKRHALYAGFRFEGGLKYYEALDRYGKRGKGITPFDWSIDAGYAFHLSSHWNFWGTASFIQSYTGRPAYAWAFGIGANYRTKLELEEREVKLNGALRVDNIGIPIFYTRREAFVLPSKAEATLEIATDLNRDHALKVALGTMWHYLPIASKMAIGGGVEYKHVGVVSLRAGGQYGSRQSSLWTVGAGVDLGWVRMDFAHLHSIHFPTLHQTIGTLSLAF